MFINTHVHATFHDRFILKIKSILTVTQVQLTQPTAESSNNSNTVINCADKLAFIDMYSLSIVVLDSKPSKPKNHTSTSIYSLLVTNYNSTFTHQMISSDQSTELQVPALVTQLINHYFVTVVIV